MTSAELLDAAITQSLAASLALSFLMARIRRQWAI